MVNGWENKNVVAGVLGVDDSVDNDGVLHVLRLLLLMLVNWRGGGMNKKSGVVGASDDDLDN